MTATSTTGFDPRILAGRSIVVTGGGSGLGLAMAKTFAAYGASVTIAGRRSERLEAASKNLEQRRTQLAMLDLAANTLAPWYTDAYTGPCRAGFETYLRGIAVDSADPKGIFLGFGDFTPGSSGAIARSQPTGTI